jgi:hypothetical protein
MLHVQRERERERERHGVVNWDGDGCEGERGGRERREKVEGRRPGCVVLSVPSWSWSEMMGHEGPGGSSGWCFRPSPQRCGCGCGSLHMRARKQPSRTSLPGTKRPLRRRRSPDAVASTAARFGLRSSWRACWRRAWLVGATPHLTSSLLHLYEVPHLNEALRSPPHTADRMAQHSASSLTRPCGARYGPLVRYLGAGTVEETDTQRVDVRPVISGDGAGAASRHNIGGVILGGSIVSYLPRGGASARERERETDCRSVYLPGVAIHGDGPTCLCPCFHPILLPSHLRAKSEGSTADRPMDLLRITCRLLWAPLLDANHRDFGSSPRSPRGLHKLTVVRLILPTRFLAIHKHQMAHHRTRSHRQVPDRNLNSFVADGGCCSIIAGRRRLQTHLLTSTRPAHSASKYFQNPLLSPTASNC